MPCPSTSTVALATLVLLYSIVGDRGAHGLQVDLRRHRLPGKQVLPKAQRRSDTLQSFDRGDTLGYAADLLIGEKSFNFLLDNGSSDLWVNRTGIPVDDPALGFDFSGPRMNVTLGYGQGTATGPVVFAPFTLGSYSIPSQALLDVDQSTEQELLFDNGISGLIGLGFGGTETSRIQKALTQADASLDTAAQTVLANVFAADPSGRTFIAFDLGRDDHVSTTPDATFSINEVPNAFLAAVNAATPVPAVRNLQAGDDPRWIVSVDSLVLAGKTVPTTSSFIGAPGGRALGLLDTGTSSARFPPDVVNAIYSSIPGAKLVKSTDPSGTIPDLWLVPCTARISVSFVFGGQPIFMDPRDFVATIPLTFKGAKTTICVNSLPTQNGIKLPSFDFILGDSFLRNAFTLYNYNGNLDFDVNAPTQPFALIVPKTKEITDDAEYKASRQAVLAGLPPEADTTDPDLVPTIQAELSAGPDGAGSQPATGTTGASTSPAKPSDSEPTGKVSSAASRTSSTLGGGMLAVLGLLLAGVVV